MKRSYQLLFRHIRKIEPSVLISAFAAMGGLWAFMEIADEVGDGEAISLDATILLALRNPQDLGDPIGPAWMEEMARDVTALGSTFMLVFVTAIVIIFLMLSRRWGAAAFAFVSVAGGTTISTLLKAGFDRPRPDLVPHGMDTFTASFPSGHSLLSAVTYLTLGALLMRVDQRAHVRAYFLFVGIAIALLVGMSRVYLGVHWPSDVAAGWAIGAAWATLCWAVMIVLQNRGAVEAPDDEKRGAAEDTGAPC
jgi:undecaprenyl-diphosphatase